MRENSGNMNFKLGNTCYNMYNTEFGVIANNLVKPTPRLCLLAYVVHPKDEY